MGLTTAIGVLEGTDSKYFAIALVFSLIVSGGCAGLLCICWASLVPAQPIVHLFAPRCITLLCWRVPAAAVDVQARVGSN